MKKVVVAVDGSQTSIDLLEQSFRYVEKEKDVSLFIFHAIESSEGKTLWYGNYPVYNVPSEEEVKEKIKQIVSKALEKTGPSRDLPIEIVVRTGISYECIVDYAKEIDASMIMIGHRGLSNLQRFFIGSVAAKVVYHAPCSVYVYRQKENVK